MNLYKNELDFESLLFSPVIAHCQLRPDTGLVDEKQLSLAAEILGTPKDSFDLFPVNTILVTTGFNKNDDIFLKEDTWLARHTPEDKPWNLEHEPRRIIGHITQNTVVDENLSVIADDSEIIKVPDIFNILTSAVVYKHLRSIDKTLEEESAKLIAEIKNGDWYVSMEALFSGFDYGFVYPNGQTKVVARNEDTAFLTKYLRCVGGGGEYNGGRIGRALKDITFTGKGLVKNPANPKSVILNSAKKFFGVYSSIDDVNSSKTIGVKLMSDDINLLKDQVTQLTEKLAEANKTIEDFDKKTVEATLAAKDAEIAELKTKIQVQGDELAAKIKGCDELVKAKEELEISAKVAKEEADKVNAELATIRAEAKKTSRVSSLVDKGVGKEDAEKIVAKFDNLNDEQFVEIVNIQAELISAKQCSMTEDEKKKQQEEMKKKAKADEAESDAGETQADTKVIEDAKVEPEVTLATDATTDIKTDTHEALTKFFSGVLANCKD